MTLFTYDLATNIGQVRLHLGDTRKDVGPRPGKFNFSDEEITYLLTVGISVNGAVVEGLVTLSNEWASVESLHREVDVTIDVKGKAKAFMDRANFLRDNPIGTGPKFGITPLVRSDAYSEVI